MSLGEMATLLFFFILSFYLLSWVLSFLRHHKSLASNYKQVKIPVGLGLYFWLLAVVFHFLGFGATGLEGAAHYRAWLLALTIVFIAGWLDDTMGDKRVKGFRGHLRHLLQNKQFSTGLLKATMIGLAALWLMVSYADSIAVGMLGTGIVVFMTNASNLLDVRPGRALKGVILIHVILFAFSEWWSYWLYFFPFWIGMAWVLPVDLKAKAMLGDSGANVVGFSAGCAVAWITPIWFQILFFVLLIWLHIHSEKYSLSIAIERFAILRKLDQWGRARSRS